MKTNMKTNMKIIVMSLCILFLNPSSNYGQDLMDNLIETEKKETKIIKDGKEMTYKHFELESALQPMSMTLHGIDIDELKYASERVSKVVMLDNDFDNEYDQIMTLNYKRPEQNFYDFELTAKGLEVSTVAENVDIQRIEKMSLPYYNSTNLLDEEGRYRVILENGETTDIVVETYQIL